MILITFSLLYSYEDGEDGTLITFLGSILASTPIKNIDEAYASDKVYFEDIQKWFDTLTLVSSDVCFDKSTNTSALLIEAEAKHKSINKYAYYIENIPLPSLPSDNKIIMDMKASVLKIVGVEEDGYLIQEFCVLGVK